MLLILSQSIIAQKFGIRAGLNYNRFLGPLENNVSETHNLSSGFHFGINYQYKLADKLFISAEVSFIQMGSRHSVTGDAYYKVPKIKGFDYKLFTEFDYQKGFLDYNIKVSNAYVSIPIIMQFKPHKSIEIVAGGYFGFLVSPRGNGTLYFDQNNKRIKLKHTLIHNYNTDNARATGGANQPFARDKPGAAIFLGDEIINLPEETGAYYFYLDEEKEGRLYRTFDMGLIGGFNYYFNKGFYLGVRYDFGLLDVTNNDVDMLKATYDETNSKMIKANHFDRNSGFQVSLGFRF